MLYIDKYTHHQNMINNNKLDINCISIIFYKFQDNKLYIFLQKNNNEKYQDIYIDNLDIYLAPIYKLNIDNLRTIYFIDIDKYEYVYKEIITKIKKIYCISLDTFIKSSVHKYEKVNNLQNENIEIILNKIKLNYIIHQKIKNHL